MEQVLEKTRQAVERYRSSNSDNLNAIRAVWGAVRNCRKTLRTLEKEQKGITTLAARELSKVMSSLPIFENILDDEAAQKSLYNRRLAEEHLAKIEEHLASVMKKLEDGKTEEITSWLDSHAVLSDVCKVLSEPMPETTYVLLFHQKRNNVLDLVTSRAPDGRIFTRFRPREFQNARKLYRLYHHNRPPLVGAVIVVDGKLHSVHGRVPEPGEGQDQLQVVAAMSREAASQPAKQFVANNPVLRSLNHLYKEGKLEKSAYVLLFIDARSSGKSEESEDAEVDADVSSDSADSGSADAPGSADSQGIDEQPADTADMDTAEGMEIAETDPAVMGQFESAARIEEEAAAKADEPEAPTAAPETSMEEPANEQTADEAASHESAEQPLAAQEAEALAEQAAVEQAADEASNFEAPVETSVEAGEISAEGSATDQDITLDPIPPLPQSDQSSDDDAVAKTAAAEPIARDEEVEEIEWDWDAVPELFTKTGNEGAVITRLYANEFSDARKLFEMFSGHSTVCGAAVIKGNSLVHVLGNVPRPEGDENQLAVLLRESNHAADKPTRDFLAEQEVLQWLHEQANGEFPDSHARVVLFVEGEGGRLTTIAVPSRGGEPQRGGRGKEDDRGARGRDRDRGGRGNERAGRDDRGRRNDRHGRDRDSGRSQKPTTFLTDFKFARDVRNNFRNLPKIVGASILGEFKSNKAPQKTPSGDSDRQQGDRGGGRRDHRRDEPRRAPTVVLAAFGRTPLKQNILINDETIRRLGLDSVV